jgi:hypothetical protein
MPSGQKIRPSGAAHITQGVAPLAGLIGSAKYRHFILFFIGVVLGRHIGLPNACIKIK